MKKIMKNKVFLIVILCIISCGIGAYAATTYKASDVVYNASDGTSMNVNDALNDLYNKSNSLKIRYASTVDTYGSQTLEFDFSDLPNKEELTIDDFITSPSTGNTGFMLPYNNTYTNKALKCETSYNKETGKLTMNLSIITIDNTSKAILYVPKAYAIYVNN